MKIIKKLLEIIVENNFDKIILEAIKKFYEYYIFQIKKLTVEFPVKYRNQDGTLFWKGSKRFPEVIEFNIDNSNNSNCFNFIKYYSILLARSINVTINNNDDCIMDIVKKSMLPKYIPPHNDIQSREEELKEIDLLKSCLNNFDVKKIDINQINPEKLEKDNDLYNHVYFIDLCSNLKARNYKIQETDEQKTKMFAGRLFPTIASTTATIIGLACLQLLTLIT